MVQARIMTNAPVYYALIQVKFTPVTAMNRYVEDIQDALRLQGYPMYQETVVQQFRFEAGAPNEPVTPNIESVKQWFMTNVESNSGFILSTDSITFQTTDYKSHNEFIRDFMLGLKQVMAHAKPTLITRLGMRYLDAVLPEPGENIENYLCEGLHGVQLHLNPLQSSNEQVFQTEIGPLLPNGVIVTRVHKMHGNLSFPPDMVPSWVIVKDRFKNTPFQWHCIIDTDHYSEGMVQPSLEDVQKQLLSLYEVVRKSFDQIVSPYALKKWA
ncbi:TIGR04255 family protein [Klebsiella sp. R390]|uniref:TIGR04255 family protein n=1 Tax=Klebsiella sp. R390 TaxID=2755400 RepID=UPI003DA7F249